MNVPRFVFSVIPGGTDGLFTHSFILSNAAIHIVGQMFEFLFLVLRIYNRSGFIGYGNSEFNFFLCFPQCLHFTFLSVLHRKGSNLI